MQMMHCEWQLAPSVLRRYLYVGGGGIQEIKPGLLYIKFQAWEGDSSAAPNHNKTFPPGAAAACYSDRWVRGIKLQLETIYTTKK